MPAVAWKATSRWWRQAPVMQQLFGPTTFVYCSPLSLAAHQGLHGGSLAVWRGVGRG